MNKQSIVIVFLVLLLGLTAYLVYRHVFREHDDMSTIKAEVVISANELIQLYNEDETKADQRFLGKVIEVSGQVSSIEITKSEATITSEIDDYIGGIIFEFSKFDGLDTIEVGNQYTIRGTCSGKLIDIVINRSVIIQ